MSHSWRRRFLHILLLAGVVALAGRQQSCATPLKALPPGAGEWKLSGPVHCAPPPTAEPKWRGTAGAKQVCRATYVGPTPVTLTVYDMPELPGATAFDAMQKWQSQPGKMAFFQGHYFGVVESPGANPATLSRFTSAVTAVLLPGVGEFHR